MKQEKDAAHVVEDVDAVYPDDSVVKELPGGLAELLQAASFVLVAPFAEPPLHRALLPVDSARERLYRKH